MSSQQTEQLYTQFLERMSELNTLDNVGNVLSWDQHVYMPSAAGAGRAEQISYIRGLYHDRFTEQRFVDLVQELGQRQLNDEQRISVQRVWRDLEREVKVPGPLVRTRHEQMSKTREAWVAARQQNCFSVVEAELKKLLELTLEYAAALKSPHQSTYDLLFDLHEPEGDLKAVEGMFERLRPQLVALTDRILSKPPLEAPAFRLKRYPQEQQVELFRRVVQMIGFDLTAGRIDSTVHPFCEKLGARDIRLTTRFDESNLLNGMSAAIHEAGHGLYDQGLPVEFEGLPTGRACSLSIHESQSLLWENQVGMSLPFWQAFFPITEELFPGATQGLDAVQFHRQINRVERSLIRVDADEVTYPLHVMMRLKLERSLVDGSLSMRELPGAWNELSRSYLGVVPLDELTGVLQDTHWYIGAFGYFPTYTMGAIYAAELMQAFAQSTQQTLPIPVAEYPRLLSWLRTHVHQRAQRVNATTLMQDILGRAPSEKAFLAYLENKYGSIYRL